MLEHCDKQSHGEGGSNLMPPVGEPALPSQHKQNHRQRSLLVSGDTRKMLTRLLSRLQFQSNINKMCYTIEIEVHDNENENENTAKSNAMI